MCEYENIGYNITTIISLIINNLEIPNNRNTDVFSKEYNQDSITRSSSIQWLVTVYYIRDFPFSPSLY